MSSQAWRFCLVYMWIISYSSLYDDDDDDGVVIQTFFRGYRSESRAVNTVPLNKTLIFRLLQRDIDFTRAAAMHYGIRVFLKETWSKVKFGRSVNKYMW